MFAAQKPVCIAIDQLCRRTMNLTPFVFKSYKSDLDMNIIVQNFKSNAHVQIPNPAGGAPIVRSKFDMKISDDRFILSKSSGPVKRTKVNLPPIVHGKFREYQDTTRLNIFIRPFYTDIVALIFMCALQLFCTYESIASGYYLVACFSVLSVILAYAVVVIKFNSESRNYLTLVQKCI